MKRFVPRYLDPASRLGEILFGLIMTLTVTLSAGLAVDEGRAGARQLLAAAIGCNLAWGIIDAVMYVMNCITVRSGKRRLIDAVRHAADENAALRQLVDDAAALPMTLRLVTAHFTARAVTRRRERFAHAAFRADENVRRGSHRPADQHRLADLGELRRQIGMARTLGAGLGVAADVLTGTFS